MNHLVIINLMPWNRKSSGYVFPIVEGIAFIGQENLRLVNPFTSIKFLGHTNVLH